MSGRWNGLLKLWKSHSVLNTAENLDFLKKCAGKLFNLEPIPRICDTISLGSVLLRAIWCSVWPGYFLFLWPIILLKKPQSLPFPLNCVLRNGMNYDNSYCIGVTCQNYVWYEEENNGLGIQVPRIPCQLLVVKPAFWEILRNVLFLPSCVRVPWRSYQFIKIRFKHYQSNGLDGDKVVLASTEPRNQLLF